MAAEAFVEADNFISGDNDLDEGVVEAMRFTTDGYVSIMRSSSTVTASSIPGFPQDISNSVCPIFQMRKRSFLNLGKVDKMRAFVQFANEVLDKVWNRRASACLRPANSSPICYRIDRGKVLECPS